MSPAVRSCVPSEASDARGVSVRWSSDRTLRLETAPAGPAGAPRVLAWREALRGLAPALLDLVPTASTLTLVFDPDRLDAPAVEAAVRTRLGEAGTDAAPAAAPRVVEIPVCYGGAFGPDAAEVAACAGLHEEELIEAHAGAEYAVAFLGFSPGFGYLEGLPERLAAPRLPMPRLRVPAGSLGIAGRQTGVYPQTMPGGWRIIGRTPLRLFDPRRDPPALLAAGDRVRFVPIGGDAYAELDQHGPEDAWAGR